MNKNIHFLPKSTHSRKTSFSSTQKSGKKHNLHPPVNSNLSLQQTNANQSPVPTLQPKLKIGTPGDIYEQEADRLSERVMMMMPDLVCPTCVEKGTVRRQEDGIHEGRSSNYGARNGVRWARGGTRTMRTYTKKISSVLIIPRL